MTSKILILNGPNLNMLGVREPEIYGVETLADIEAACRARGAEFGLDVDFHQSNHEGDLVTWVQGAGDTHAGLIVNAGALTHTSVALLDALRAVDLPVVEVHLSNIHRRGSFRRHSYVAQAAVGMIAGFGATSYLLALDALAHILQSSGTAA